MADNIKDLGQINFKVDASDLKGIMQPAGVPRIQPPQLPNAGRIAPSMPDWARAWNAGKDFARNPMSEWKGLRDMFAEAMPKPPLVPPVAPVAAAATEAGGGAAAVGGGAAAPAGLAALAGGPIGIALAALTALAAAATLAAKAIEKLKEWARQLRADTLADIARFQSMNGALAASTASTQVQQMMADIQSAQARGPSLAVANAMESARDRQKQALGDRISPVRNIGVAAVAMAEGAMYAVARTALSVLETIGRGIITIYETVDRITGLFTALIDALNRYLPFLRVIYNALTPAASGGNANAWAMADIAAMSGKPRGWRPF